MLSHSKHNNNIITAARSEILSLSIHNNNSISATKGEMLSLSIHFLSFYHLKNLGSTSGFRATDGLARAHCDETEFWTFLLFGSLFFLSIYIYAPPDDQTNKMTSAPSEVSDQPGHPHSLIRVFAVRKNKHWVLSYPMCALQRLIRLGECPG